MEKLRANAETRGIYRWELRRTKQTMAVFCRANNARCDGEHTTLAPVQSRQVPGELPSTNRWKYSKTSGGSELFRQKNSGSSSRARVSSSLSNFLINVTERACGQQRPPPSWSSRRPRGVTRLRTRGSTTAAAARCHFGYRTHTLHTGVWRK